ncbi:hypothetical protein MMC19_004686 [Ptychographa xylographoides]|nr:hypothetical protein [Ptychographa xylographoides]
MRFSEIFSLMALCALSSVQAAPVAAPNANDLAARDPLIIVVEEYMDHSSPQVHGHRKDRVDPQVYCSPLQDDLC